jgi:anti-sigma B factor antagonist
VVTLDEHLRVTVRKEADRVVLELCGELDLLAAPQLQRELDGVAVPAKSILVLDLQQLEFIDSAGLRVIIAAQDRARDDGREFAVTRSTTQVERVFEIVGAGKLLRIIGTADEVVA